MANPTTNFGWQMPTNTDLVKDLPADFEVFGQAVDTSLMDLKGGTTGQVLSKASNTDMDFTWVAQDDSNAIQNAIVDAKGDLISATAADTPARLAVGTNGQVLTADSTQSTGLAWTTISSGGMTLLSTTTLSGASTTISGISGSYNRLIAVVFGMTNNTANGYFRLAPNNDTTLSSSFGTTGNTSVGTVAGSYIYVGQGTNVDFILRTNSNNIYTIIFDNYASTTSYKSFITYGTMINSGNNQRPGFSAGAYETTTAITSLTFSNSGGHFSAGTVLLYGVK